MVTHSVSLPPEECDSNDANGFLNKYTAQSMLNEFRWALQPGADFPESTLIDALRDPRPCVAMATPSYAC